MPQRNDKVLVGRNAETFAQSLLTERGFVVEDLNQARRTNFWTYDLLASRNGRDCFVSVKCARAKREVYLGSAASLRRLNDDAVVMIFLPPTKDSEIAFVPGRFELLIIPGNIVRDEALAAHEHYNRFHPGSASHSVMIKDKIDRNPTTKSGAVFQNWRRLYLDSWVSFDVVASRAACR